MSGPDRYDAVVVGTGQGGKPLAGALAEAGHHTAIIEKNDRVGGTCVLTGCTPTKTMAASARIAHLARRAGDYGVATGPVRVDMGRVRERKRDVVEQWSEGNREGLERHETDDRGNIPVDERRRTAVDGIWALGDVTGAPPFTHTSYDDYRVIEDDLLGDGTRTTSGRTLTYAVFTDPQLGRVGLTEAQAEEEGHEVRVARLPMSHVARAVEMDETRGFMKAVVDARTDQILGAAILGVEGGEIASALKIAMMGRLPYTALRDAVLPHPTLAESLNNLFMTLD